MDVHRTGISVLLIEDDDRVAAAQELVLRRHGIHVTRAATAFQALEHLRPRQGRDRGVNRGGGCGDGPDGGPGRGPDGVGVFDVIVLDLGLPDIDGLTLCRELRRITATPVIISSARGDLTTRLHGLHTGADDYLIKPYDLRELIAKVHVLIRRTRSASGSTTALYEVSDAGAVQGAGVTPAAIPAAVPAPAVAATAVPAVRDAGVVRVGPVTIDHAARMVLVAGAPVIMTAKEFDLLALLATAPGVVFRRDQITTALWGRRSAAVDHNLDVLIARLRRTLGQPTLIGTVRTIGYYLGPRPGTTTPPHLPPAGA